MTHRPATNLRRECAAWLKASLGCQSVEFDVALASTQGGKARTVDLRGEKYDSRWRRSKSSGVGVFLAAVVLQNVPPLFAFAADLSITPNRLLVISLLLIGAGHIGRIRTREYIWVQCKELVRPVRCADVQALNTAVEEVRRDETAKWKPAEVMLLTGTEGLEGDALELARAAGIRCFLWTGSAFEEALSWQRATK